MDAIIVEFLWSLFFIISSLPGILAPVPEGSPRPYGPVIQFVCGVILFVLAYLKISLIR